MMDSGCGSVRRARITTACSGRDMDKVPKAKRRQRAADAGRYPAQTACRVDKGDVRFRRKAVGGAYELPT
jgi:hypothetical protein